MPGRTGAKLSFISGYQSPDTSNKRWFNICYASLYCNDSKPVGPPVYDFSVDEILNWMTKLAPFVGSVLIPVVTVWIKLRNDRRDPAAVHSMQQTAKLYESLPDVARDPIKKLIEVQANEYSKAMIRKVRRIPNWSGRSATIFVGVVTGVALYFLIQWAIVWGWAFIGVALVAFFGGGLMLAGGLQWFKYPDEEEKDEQTDSTSGDREPDASVEKVQA